MFGTGLCGWWLFAVRNLATAADGRNSGSEQLQKRMTADRTVEKGKWQMIALSLESTISDLCFSKLLCSSSKHRMSLSQYFSRSYDNFNFRLKVRLGVALLEQTYSVHAQAVTEAGTLENTTKLVSYARQ